MRIVVKYSFVISLSTQSISYYQCIGYWDPRKRLQPVNNVTHNIAYAIVTRNTSKWTIYF